MTVRFARTVGNHGGVSHTYMGFSRDPAWCQPPDEGYLRGTITDLAGLSPALRRSVILIDAGQASWPTDLVCAAISQLADLGRVLRGLDRDLRDDAGRTVLTQPICLYEGDSIEHARREVLDGVPFLKVGDRGILSWVPASDNG